MLNPIKRGDLKVQTQIQMQKSETTKIRHKNCHDVVPTDIGPPLRRMGTNHLPSKMANKGTVLAKSMIYTSETITTQ